ncbi:hypothetical protein FCV36_08835 [Clostridium sporogenes]|nr:hypothetical protein [Clostridium sporogenes]
MTLVSLYKIKLAEVIIFILLNLFATPNALKIYTRFGLLKRDMWLQRRLNWLRDSNLFFYKIY